MTTAPLVSVVMTSHNRATLIGQSIASVLEQSLADLELIIVDDGSTDGSVAVIEAIDDARIVLVALAKCSVSEARNAGIARARGEFIAFLDCDDLFLPDYLRSQIDTLRAHPHADAVYAMGQEFDATGRLPPLRGYPMRYPGDAFRSMLYNDFTCSIAVLARAAAVRSAPTFDSALEPSEDRAFWTRFACGRQMVFNEQVLVLIRRHEGNLSGPASPRFTLFLRGHVRVIEAIEREADLPADVRDQLPLFYRNACNGAAFLAWNTGHRALALRYVREAVQRSGMPLSALAQIAWYIVMRRCLDRFSAGRRLARALLEWRRGLRTTVPLAER